MLVVERYCVETHLPKKGRVYLFGFLEAKLVSFPNNLGGEEGQVGYPLLTLVDFCWEPGSCLVANWPWSLDLLSETVVLHSQSCH